MAKKRKKHIKRGNDKLLILYRTVVVVAIVAGIGTLFIALITPLISDSKKVLGEETYFAQGRGNSGNTGQARPNPAQDKVNEQIQNLPQEVSPEKIEKLRNLPPIQAESKGGNGRVDITRG